MSYNVSTNGKGESAVKVFTMICNQDGCKDKIGTEKGENKSALNVRARSLGWRGYSATEHYCPMHSNFRSAKKADKAEAKSVTKKQVAQTKAVKGAKQVSTDNGVKTTITKSGAKITVGNRVPARETAAPVGGQSTGKLARSAKKSATR